MSAADLKKALEGAGAAPMYHEQTYLAIIAVALIEVLEYFEAAVTDD